MKKIISEYSNALTIIFFLLTIVISIYLVGWKLSVKERNFLNVFSVIGGMVSMFGLIIALIQIIALQEISAVTQATISETKSKLILGISISDVSESIKMIGEIDSYIGNQKYEIARLKLIDLRDKLIQFKNNEEFKKIIAEGDISDIIIGLNFEISQLYNIIFSEIEMKYDSDSISKQLQDIATHINAFKNNIRYQTI